MNFHETVAIKRSSYFSPQAIQTIVRRTIQRRGAPRSTMESILQLARDIAGELGLDLELDREELVQRVSGKIQSALDYSHSFSKEGYHNEAQQVEHTIRS